MENINIENTKTILAFAQYIDALAFSDKEKQNSDIVYNDFYLMPKEIIFTPLVNCNSEFLEKMYKQNLTTYRMFYDQELIDQIAQLKVRCPLTIDERLQDNAFGTIFQIIKTGATVSRDPMKVCAPKKINPKAANHLYSHEVAHILKNSNLNEQKLIITYEEVIPILIELISAHNKLETKDVFAYRKNSIIDTAKTYAHNKNLYNITNTEEKDLFYINMSISGNYLNSFYYALCFYNLYLIDPDLILSYVQAVLSGKLTTLDMIYDFEYSYGSNGVQNNYKEGLYNYSLKLK